jgi:predicted transcriptional regulator of viral defense system
MDYKPLSARERRLIAEVENRNLIIFTSMEASKVLGVGRKTAHRALNRLEDKEAVVRVERGKYIIKRFYDELDIYEIASHIVEPAYLSLWSGLHYYGYTTQVPKEVFLVVTRARKVLDLQGRRVRYVKVRSPFFFGYQSIGRTIVAEPEKLLLDCLAFPKYAGGFSEIKKAVEGADIDFHKIVEYAIRTGSDTICSRLGYLLNMVKKKFNEHSLLRHRSKSYVLLDPSGGDAIVATSLKWNVRVNIEVE